MGWQRQPSGGAPRNTQCLGEISSVTSTVNYHSLRQHPCAHIYTSVARWVWSKVHELSQKSLCFQKKLIHKIFLKNCPDFHLLTGGGGETPLYVGMTMTVYVVQMTLSQILYKVFTNNV